MPSTLLFYVFGWDTKTLQASTIHVNTSEFKVIKTEIIGPVLLHLLKQDSRRYKFLKLFRNNRVRVDKQHFKTAQDDPSIVYSTPWNNFIGDLPFVLSFKLKEGNVVPSPNEFAIQNIDAKNFTCVNEIEIFGKKVIYARC